MRLDSNTLYGERLLPIIFFNANSDADTWHDMDTDTSIVADPGILGGGA
jgi:hypothetical protein